MTATKPSEQSLHIKISSPPPKSTTGLSFAELGLHTYMIENVDTRGLFQQRLTVIAAAGASTAPTVYRWQKALIAKGLVIVVEKSYRDKTDGFRVPPVLRPIPRETGIPSSVKQVPASPVKGRSL